MIILKSRHEIDRMRVACCIVAEVLEGLRSLVCPGVTTFDLEQFASAEAHKLVYDGFYGDAAITVPVGVVSDTANQLIAATESSLYAAIEMAIPGNRLGDISAAVQGYVESRGYSVVRDFVGHGIGRSLHEDPQIPNYGFPGKGVKLKPGMVLAIEPMINEKSHEVKVLDDNWTVITCDGGLSAHFEHTVAITENGPEILTRICSK